MSGSAPKITLLDIETSPNIVYTWGKFEQNAIKRIQRWSILSCAYKQLGSKRVECFARPDFRDRSDRAIVKAVYKVVNDSDIIIAHNGDRFDVTKLRAKFAQHGLPPTRPFKTIDTKKIGKSNFAFYSNSLNDIADELDLGQKLDTGGFDLWERCMSGFERHGKVDRAAWRDMCRYNRHDVVLLERVYEHLRAWYPSHPNVALLSGAGNGECPVCASGHVQKRGFQVLKLRKAQRLQCGECGHWFHRSLRA